MDSTRASWTTGAPKWAAVLILTAASTTAIGWALGRSGDSWRSPPHALVPITTNVIAPSPAPVRSAASPDQSGEVSQAPRMTEGTRGPETSTAPSPAPTQPTATAPPLDSSKSLEPSPAPLRKLININTASQGELELLPGIGPALAKRILDHRTTKGPFKRIDDLDSVKGIGPKILQRLRPQITVD